MELDRPPLWSHDVGIVEDDSLVLRDPRLAQGEAATAIGQSPSFVDGPRVSEVTRDVRIKLHPFLRIWRNRDRFDNRRIDGPCTAQRLLQQDLSCKLLWGWIIDKHGQQVKSMWSDLSIEPPFVIRDVDRQRRLGH